MTFNPGKYSITVALGLAGVIALIYGLAFLAKKFKTKHSINKDLNIESIMHVNHKVKLMIVNVASQRLLLGVTPDSVTTLSELKNFKQITESEMEREQCLKDSC